MKLRSLRRPAVIGTAAVTALALGLTGTAASQALITTSDIKNETIRSRDIKNGTITAADLRGNSVNSAEIAANAVRSGEIAPNAVRSSEIAANAVGSSEIAANAVGSSEIAPNAVGSSEIADGSVRPEDLSDAAANRIQSDVFVGEHWGQILRNTLETGVASLRSGPYALNAEPPLGSGSLQLLTGNSSSQVTFGNEVDFVGDNLVNTLGNHVGFSVFTTGENNGRGTHNLPNIKLEIDPNVAGVGTNYGTLSFVPTKAAANNAWTDFNEDDGEWFLTGAAGNAINCNQATTCNFAQIKTKLANATILTVGVGKGRDHAFQGAVDALRIGNDVYDFEARGVFTGSA